jgi:hypothetical protein
MKEPPPERRRHPRQCAAGEVQVRSEGGALEIRGRLVDASAYGFRVAHEGAPPDAGREMRFEYRGAAGRARVVWNRVVGREVETGFVVLAAAPAKN